MVRSLFLELVECFKNGTLKPLPRSVFPIQEVEGAFTEPVSVEAADSNVTENVNLGVEDPLLRIQGSPRVRVTARIGPAPLPSPGVTAPGRRKR